MQSKLPFVLTHGDPHHYNILQNSDKVWLVDWDGLKIAPIERDLWHYENAPLLDAYQDIDSHLKINYELCAFYRLQRFFEDICFYLKQVLLKKNRTKQQSEEDRNSFLNHWGWNVCLKADI